MYNVSRNFKNLQKHTGDKTAVKRQCVLEHMLLFFCRELGVLLLVLQISRLWEEFYGPSLSTSWVIYQSYSQYLWSIKTNDARFDSVYLSSYLPLNYPTHFLHKKAVIMLKGAQIVIVKSPQHLFA